MTITVGELIEKLKDMPKDAPFKAWLPGGTLIFVGPFGGPATPAMVGETCLIEVSYEEPR